MAAVTLTTHPPRSDHATIADQVAALAAAEPGLTARTSEHLVRALGEGRLVVAQDAERVVGFVLAERCGPLWEAASLYVAPSHRDAAIFTELIRACEQIVDADWIVATFDVRFAEYLERRRRYRRIGVWGAIWRTRGAFALARLGRERRGQVARHLRQARPIILLGHHR